MERQVTPLWSCEPGRCVVVPVTAASKVRARAYELWEQAGRPAGRELEFWLEAERQIEDEREERKGSDTSSKR